MRITPLVSKVMAVLALSVLPCGCTSQTASDPGPAAVSELTSSGGHGHPHDSNSHGGHGLDDAHPGHHHGDDHHGPHDGHVIELGRGEFHAELVDDEVAGTQTVYILDKDLKERLIDATSITMNLISDSQPRGFELAAATSGRASRFDLTDRTLLELLHEPEATGKLRVTIDGTPYSGDLEYHEHEHPHKTGHREAQTPSGIF